MEEIANVETALIIEFRRRVMSPTSNLFVSPRALTQICVCVLAVALTVLDCHAQGRTGYSRFPTTRLFDAPRLLKQQISEAEESIGQKQYSDAVARLGDILQQGQDVSENETLNQDYFVETEFAGNQEDRNQESLFRKARRLIGTLPAAGRETYELRYGALARKALSDAAAQRDWQQVRDVRRRYFHTEAGYEASEILARRAMLLGHPLEASLILDEVVTSRRAVTQLGDSIVLLHTAACDSADRELPVESELARTYDSLSVTVAGESTPGPTAAELGRWLKSRYARTSVPPKKLASYPIGGGTPHRNGDASGELPLRNLRWMVETTATPRQAKQLLSRSSEMIARGTYIPPTLSPLRVGPYLLMRSTEKVFGVDYITGKRVFQHPTSAASVPSGTEEIDPLTLSPQEDDEDDFLSQRVWNDLPYGQLASDGQLLYFLHDLEKVASVYPSRGLMPNRQFGERKQNSMVALDLASEGKMLWVIGKGSDRDTETVQPFFLGPPLPLDGRLYVMTEMAGDINLCCLDPATGDELWRQQLVAAEESGGIASDPIRRIAGAVPTYHEGVLICPTGTGITVAIDLYDRTLRWSHQYPRADNLAPMSISSGGSFIFSRASNRWLNGAAIAAGTAVAITPVETNLLSVFDVATGNPLFPSIDRADARYLAGIRDQQLIVVGDDFVAAYSLKDGEQKWRTPKSMLSSNRSICGRGYFGDHEYFVPLSSNEILSVALDNGTVTGTRKLDFQLGNLVANQGQIISQGVTELSVAYGEATLAPLVESLLRQTPNDVFALTRKAELLIQSDDRLGALAVLDRAREIDPANDTAKLLSVDAMLGILRADPAAEPSLFDRLETMVDEPEQVAELYRLKILAAISRSKYPIAVERMLELSDLVCSNGAEFKTFAIDEIRRCSIDAWLAARSAEINRAVDKAERAELTALVESHTGKNTLNATRTLMRMTAQFAPLGGTETLRAELTRGLGLNVSPVQLERVSLGTNPSTNAGIMTLDDQRLASLSAAYTAGGLTQNAKFIQSLQDTRSNGESEADNPDAVSVDSKPAGILKHLWPDPVTVSWSESGSSSFPQTRNLQRFAPMRFFDRRQFHDWHVVTGGNPSVAFHDSRGLPVALPFDVSLNGESAVTEVMLSGSIAIMVFRTEIVAIDMVRLLNKAPDPVLWRRPTSNDSTPSVKLRNRQNPFGDLVYQLRINGSEARYPLPDMFIGPVIGDRIFVRQASELSCINLLTSEVLWQTNCQLSSGVTVTDGDQIAVVSADVNAVELFDIHDGRQLAKKPWDHGLTWNSTADAVLTYKAIDEDANPSGGKAYEIKLVSPFVDEPILEMQASEISLPRDNLPSNFCSVVGGELFVSIDRLGNTKVWDLVAAKEIASLKLPPYSDMLKMHFARIRDQLFILADRPHQATTSLDGQTVHEETESITKSHYRVRGLFAVSLKTGELQWQREFDQAWGCTAIQASETPLLVLNRYRKIFARTSAGEIKQYVDLIGLDLDTGETRIEVLHQPVRPSTAVGTNTSVPLLDHKLKCVIGLDTALISFGDEPKSAQPDQ